MTSNAEGNGGVNIRPTARKSIHVHCGTCPFIFNETMGRYGCNSHHRNERKTTCSQDDQGTDVVDNVMSKMAQRQHTPSNSLLIQKDCDRRNSVDVLNNDHSDDSDDENMLSKSSPASLSPLYYSDESYSSALQIENNRSRNGLQTSSSSDLAQMNNFNVRGITTAPELKTRTQRNKLKSISIVILFGIVAVAIGVKRDYFTTHINTTSNISNELNFYNDINSLGAKYKVNSDSILRIRIGISTISKNEGTASFIFVYDSTAENFNPTIFNNFMEELASTTVKYLRNDGDSAQLVVVDTKNIETDLELMDLHQDVDKTGVMLVPNIHDVPSELAMAFHFYCDEYNPLVKRSAIFFTLDSATCLYNKKLTHQYIEKCLSKKWYNIHEDKIGPLLTRVVNIVVDATNIA